jgi:hypothetical protein
MLGVVKITYVCEVDLAGMTRIILLHVELVELMVTLLNMFLNQQPFSSLASAA